jgi:hypothetical protein
MLKMFITCASFLFSESQRSTDINTIQGFKFAIDRTKGPLAGDDEKQ